MKTLYIIGGTMGAGKTTVCRQLQKKLKNNVFLDGDWCWDMQPFTVTEETKAMVLDNICHLLNSFLGCSAYENILFCWVLHEQSILDALLSRLNTDGCRILCFSLLCSPEALTARLTRDISAGLRQPDVLPRSLTRIPLYQKLNTIKIDVSSLSAEEAAEEILHLPVLS